MTTLLAIALLASIILLGTIFIPLEKEVKIHRINGGTCKMYCDKDDKEGRYKRGDVGYTISHVTDEDEVQVNFGKAKIWVKLEDIRLIDEDKR